MPYDPKPIDNSAIDLGPELSQLVETLARNNHDLWASARMAEGWHYGPQRDEAKRETPLLVAYDELPESEKRIDRQNAVETLKSIIQFGGKVEAPQASTPPGNDATGLTAWHPGRNPPGRYEEYLDLGTRANAKGQSLLACDIANEALRLWPRDSALRQIKALALARMGSPEQARNLLSGLTAAPNDEETAGILARTFKDIWLRTADARDLRSAVDNYLAAYRDCPDHYWTGINAATLSWALGETAKAVSLAREISRTCLDRLASAPADQKYWLTATLAEATLVLAASHDPSGSGGDWPEVERLYREARGLAADDFGHVFSTWRNALIVLRHLPSSVAERIERAFAVPRVAAFAGHRVDSPGRVTPRFPPEIVPRMKAAIRDELIRLQVGVGFSTAASGSDILFLEALQELGGKTHIVLPCNREQFIADSVAESGGDWVERFQAVVAKADETILVSDQRLILGGVSFRYASDVLDGLATMRASQYETRLLHIAVWDGRPGDGPGGTHDTVARWRARGRDVHITSPRDMQAGISMPAAEVTGGATLIGSESTGIAAGVVSEIRAMIFADVKHFSQLSESQIPGFLRDFMGPVAAFARQAIPAPEFQNTWGDGLFFVFARVGDAARFALKLRERVAAINRAEAKLPDDMSLRIALHAGPVFRFQDQMIGRQNYVGSHVNTAARIEPVTPEGRVYATEAFAALATLDAPGQFRFDYVGKVPLHKNFGLFSLYDVSQT